VIAAPAGYQGGSAAPIGCRLGRADRPDV